MPVVNYDAVIIGAGFAGIYMLHRLRQRGLSVRAYERGDGVGGTWYWNRYPGARCDVQSMEYSYQFDQTLQQEWQWSERYASQPEILDYANHVADRFGLREDIQFNTVVKRAHFDETAGCWQVGTDQGEEIATKYLIMATGSLSVPNVPNISGMEDFEGDSYHTGEWPQGGVDFTDRDVAVIGTGSSAIQAIPEIARQAEQLYVLQRTPAYAIPARNRPFHPGEQESIKADYDSFRQQAASTPSGIGFEIREEYALEASAEARQQQYEQHWQAGGLAFIGAYGDLLIDSNANDTAAEFVRGKIREIVNSPRTAEVLSPLQTFGCKRICADSGYYETFNRDNVSLIDLHEEPIQAIIAQGVVTAQQVVEVDAIVYATGFDAVTGALARIDIRGRNHVALTDKWAEGPTTYLGLGTEGFPNLFMINGPGSPSVLTNMLPSIEQHVEWIDNCISHLQSHGYQAIEPTLGAELAWVDRVNSLAERTLYPTCNSWYLGANIPGKPRVFMAYIGFPAYVAKCAEVEAAGYTGFTIT
ncbi:MAG: NAD(P)/FAD-dependent oxidoreductase [Gammaproteobacteria bacterium]